VINVDLNSKDPQIVIEATITDDSTIPHTVLLTKSVNFSDPNSFPAIQNATVTVNDDLGNTVTFAETSPGVYKNTTLKGVPGRTYSLKILAEGKTFTSSCKMPAKVPLDSVVFESFSFGNQSDDNSEKSFRPVYTDPAGKGNYYKFNLQKGDSISKTIFLIDDDIVDGSVNKRPLFDRELSLKKGDSVTLQMLCISKEVNLYFYSMDQSSGGPGGTASPANPVTNIQGAALGYFSAHTLQTVKLRIP
jgi:hypothetical protein